MAIAFTAIVGCVVGAIVMTNLYVAGKVGSVVPGALLAVGGIVTSVILYFTYAKRKR